MIGKCVLGLALCLSISLAASGAEIVIAGDDNDRQVSETSMPWVGQADMRLGAGNTESSGGVFVFELPALPAGETVNTADFAFSIVGGSNWRSLFEKGLDLYGVRVSSDPAVLQTDYYKGAYGADAAATAIEPYIIYEAEELNQAAPGELGRHDTTNEAALGAWIQSLYASDDYVAGGANYAFLRLNPRDDFTSTYRYWSAASANNASEADRPVLTLTTIPEPATLSLLALGAAGLIRRRR